MSRLNGKTREVLDACLSNESPEVRAKVYEIINLSGLDADDPMFLILALTGQMRVFLEAAPVELSQLLSDWKDHNARSLEEIGDAIAIVKDTQQQQARTIGELMDAVSDRYVAGIKEAGMATTSAIAEANGETLAKAKIALRQTQELKDEILRLHAGVESDRQSNELVIKKLLERTVHNIQELKQVAQTIHHSGATIKRIQQDTIWVKFADWCSPLLALVVVGLIGFGVGLASMSFKYKALYEEHNDLFNTTAREVLDWNVARYNKCRKDENPKCTFWIVPPEERK